MKVERTGADCGEIEMVVKVKVWNTTPVPGDVQHARGCYCDLDAHYGTCYRLGTIERAP